MWSALLSLEWPAASCQDMRVATDFSVKVLCVVVYIEGLGKVLPNWLQLFLERIRANKRESE
jgi:hypothetical protein